MWICISCFVLMCVVVIWATCAASGMHDDDEEQMAAIEKWKEKHNRE